MVVVVVIVVTIVRHDDGAGGDDDGGDVDGGDDDRIAEWRWWYHTREGRVCSPRATARSDPPAALSTDRPLAQLA